MCVVPCGNRKVWDSNPSAGPVRARFVYIGPFSKKCREYAERFFPSDWCILSAKYGFLFPNDLVEGPYNVSFNDPQSRPISLEALSAQVKRKGLDKYDRIVVLGGKNYTTIIERVFAGKEVSAPLRGCRGIGYMMGRLKDSIDRGVPL